MSLSSMALGYSICKLTMETKKTSVTESEEVDDLSSVCTFRQCGLNLLPDITRSSLQFKIGFKHIQMKYEFKMSFLGDLRGMEEVGQLVSKGTRFS